MNFCVFWCYNTTNILTSQNIFEENQNSDVEKCNIVDAVNLKREERNQYSTYLLCTSYGDAYTKRQQHVDGLKRGTPSRIVSFALNSESSYIIKEYNFAKQTILQI